MCVKYVAHLSFSSVMFAYYPALSFDVVHVADVTTIDASMLHNVVGRDEEIKFFKTCLTMMYQEDHDEKTREEIVLQLHK